MSIFADRTAACTRQIDSTWFTSDFAAVVRTLSISHERRVMQPVGCVDLVYSWLVVVVVVRRLSVPHLAASAMTLIPG